MLKKVVICLTVCFITLVYGCNSKPDGVPPYCIMVDGQMYRCFGKVIVEESNVEILGHITSCVEDSLYPIEDNQSNFPECLEQPYGMFDGEVLVYYSDSWHKCYLTEGNSNGKE